MNEEILELPESPFRYEEMVHIHLGSQLITGEDKSWLTRQLIIKEKTVEEISAMCELLHDYLNELSHKLRQGNRLWFAKRTNQ